MSSKGIEPFTDLTNSFTENHHYQSDHLPFVKQLLFINLAPQTEIGDTINFTLFFLFIVARMASKQSNINLNKK